MTRTAVTRRAAVVSLLAVALLAAACGQDPSEPSGGAASQGSSSAPAPVTGFVQVADGVLVEYRDWGGEGPPIVLLTGLGNTAAVFDDLAPRLTANHRVIGLTRRGFGPSTITADGYDVPTRVADDLAALDALGIDRALLVGHSIAGDELTGIAQTRPDLPVGLVYLDAAFDRSDPATAIFDECLPKVPQLEQVVDVTYFMREVNGAPEVTDLAGAAEFQRLMLGGPLPMTEIRRQVFVRPGGVVNPVDTSVVQGLINDGSAAFTPVYTGITVPVTALVGDDADPAVAFPQAAQASEDVRASLSECAAGIAEVKRTAGADRVRSQVPGAVVEIVPGGPHYFFLGQPDLVAAKILATAERAGW